MTIPDHWVSASSDQLGTEKDFLLVFFQENPEASHLKS